MKYDVKTMLCFCSTFSCVRPNDGGDDSHRRNQDFLLRMHFSSRKKLTAVFSRRPQNTG